MKIDIAGNRWRFWMAPDLTPEERGQAGHAVSLALIDPPRPQAELRAVCVRAAMAQYQGSPSRRAKTLEREYRRYLAGPWLLERDLETLPEPRVAARCLLHRLGRINGGRSLCWQRIFDIASSPQD